MNDIEEIKIKFETQGFVHLRGVIPPDMLVRAREAFDSAAKKYDAAKRNNSKANDSLGYFDIPHILDQNEVFIDLVDLPLILSVLTSAVGSDIQLIQTMGRLFYPGPTFTAPWHSDIPQVLGIDHGAGKCLMVKAHFFLEDLKPDQGCLAFIPGSHRYPAYHPKPKIRNIDSSDLVIKTVPRAGDIVLFNTHLLHMALDNSSDQVRKSIIYAYGHYWMKNYASAVPSDLDRYATTEQRKQLFGVDIEGIPHFNRRLNGNVLAQKANTVYDAGKRILKKILTRS